MSVGIVIVVAIVFALGGVAMTVFALRTIAEWWEVARLAGPRIQFRILLVIGGLLLFMGILGGFVSRWDPLAEVKRHYETSLVATALGVAFLLAAGYTLLRAQRER